MRRRAFILALGGAGAGALTRPALAQGQPPRIGFVSFQSAALADHVEYLRDGLRQLGYVEGKTIELEPHFTDGDRQRTRDVIRMLLQKNVALLVVWTSTAIQIAKETTQTVPVVMIIAGNPVAAGLVKSLSHPGGNITGVSMTGGEAIGKRIEVLRELRPGIRTVGYLGLQTTAFSQFVEETKLNADKIGLGVVVRTVAQPDALDAALFEDMKREGVEAVIVQPILTGHRDRVVALATAAKLPVISDYSTFAEAGALATFGVDQGAQIRRVAYYVDRILKGAKPADLPIEQPTKFELVINLKTAKAFGIEVSPMLIARADQVIE